MKSHTTERFRKLFRALPHQIQKQGRDAGSSNKITITRV
jgi:hypothetical protein